jgi:hypothetical protein
MLREGAGGDGRRGRVVISQAVSRKEARDGYDLQFQIRVLVEGGGWWQLQNVGSL